MNRVIKVCHDLIHPFVGVVNWNAVCLQPGRMTGEGFARQWAQIPSSKSAKGNMSKGIPKSDCLLLVVRFHKKLLPLEFVIS